MRRRRAAWGLALWWWKPALRLSKTSVSWSRRMHPLNRARTWKGADGLIQIDPGEVAAFDASVIFFPVADPFVGNGGGEAALCELVEGGLVVLEG